LNPFSNPGVSDNIIDTEDMEMFDEIPDDILLEMINNDKDGVWKAVEK
jgi:hypothetical protein